MNNQLVAFVAGRSGGHIIPALTLAQAIKNEHPATDIIFFTTAYPLDQAIIKKHGRVISKYVALNLGNVPFFNIFKILVFLINFARAFYKSIKTLRAHKPNHVIAMGGYISIPVCLAARILKIPIHLYDLDAKPGKGTRFLAHYAQKIFICFEQARDYLPANKCEVTAYPIRFEKSAQDLSLDTALEQLHLQPNKKTIFINGGSQGSVFINNRVKEWLELNPHLSSLIQIIHQTGSTDTTNWQEFYREQEIPALIFAYKEDLAACYVAADLIICRSGAGSLFEALFFGKPCLTIPLETATTGHQMYNARALSQKYPELITMLTEQEIKQDNMALFRVLNKHIYAHPSLYSSSSPGKPLHSQQNS